MPNLSKLQVAGANARLSTDHKRFNNLLRQIERARETLAAWRENAPVFRSTYAQVITPLRDSLIASQRQWLFGLDALLSESGWSRAERAAIEDIVRDELRELLELNEADAELKAFFDKYSDVSFEEHEQESLAVMKEVTEMMTGLNLGRKALRSEDDLFERVQAKMAARDAAAAERTANRPRRMTAAQQRQAAEAQLARQSVREIYRKLVSSLHPDREPDPALREEKTELMQRVNQAYEANDLLTLLEMQLRIEQIDNEHISNASTERIRRFNKILAEQLASIKTEIEAAETELGIEFHLEPGHNPHKLGAVIEERMQLLRADLAIQQRNRRLLADRAAIRNWLRQERRRKRDARWLGESPF